ncbi:MAG TPA: biotin/lipoyl-containing protein [Terriglobales bacterium]|jgi:pyruvate dehydrogenase E2 component (dihydrolipoamide acetyltransferase)|nr:biotin/lipoyl-containing protein [Terriglobales bacterium]
MAYKIVMPQLGLTMEEGSVTGWLKKTGDFIEKGDPLFTVETDKIEMEVESMGKGYLGEILVEVNQKVPVGTLLAMLNDKPESDA